MVKLEVGKAYMTGTKHVALVYKNNPDQFPADKVYVGKNTTVQDFLDWINWFQAQNQDFNRYCSKFNGGK